MRKQILKIAILAVILSGCQSEIHRTPNIRLQEFPLMEEAAAEELYILCEKEDGRCDNFNEWLDSVVKFKNRYDVYKKHYNQNKK